MDRSLVVSLSSLYGLQACNYLFPLVTVPYLARVLGARGWGLVAFSQGFGYFLQVAIEYGFNVSGTRTVAQNRDYIEVRSAILSEVLAAKTVAALIVFAAAVILKPWLPRFALDPRLLWGALLWAAGQAFSMTWYYQGIERLRPALAAELSANTASTIAIILLVRGPEDGWRVLALQGCASLIAAAVACRWACRGVPLHPPAWQSVRELYRSAWPLFSYRTALTLYSTGNSFLLGLLARATAVGYFGGADRIARAFLALVNPLAQAAYSRVSYLARHGAGEADRLRKIALVAAASIGLASGAIVWLSAPLLVRLLLGPEFGPAIPALRILALLCPLIAVNTVLAFVWLLPRFMDARLNRVTLMAGLINIGLALLLARRYSHLGMAAAVVLTESFVLASLIWSARSSDPVQ